MNDTIIKNLFKKDTTEIIEGQIIAKKSGGFWLVRDPLGRTSTASSAAIWKPNVDWVKVHSGRIVGRAKQRDTIQTYYV